MLFIYCFLGAKEIDIAATLEHIRDQRMQMVKTKHQFEFALASVAEEVTAILKALPQQQWWCHCFAWWLSNIGSCRFLLIGRKGGHFDFVFSSTIYVPQFIEMYTYWCIASQIYFSVLFFVGSFEGACYIRLFFEDL